MDRRFNPSLPSTLSIIHPYFNSCPGTIMAQTQNQSAISTNLLMIFFSEKISARKISKDLMPERNTSVSMIMKWIQGQGWLLRMDGLKHRCQFQSPAMDFLFKQKPTPPFIMLRAFFIENHSK